MNSNSKSGIISPKEIGVSKIEGDRFDNFCGTNRKLSQIVDKLRDSYNWDVVLVS